MEAVDSEGNVLDISNAEPSRHERLKVFRKLLKKQGFAPRVLVTDKLKLRSSQERTAASCRASAA